MNYVRLQQDFIKDLDYENTHYNSRYASCLVTEKYHDYIGIGNECMVCFLPPNEVYIDITKVVRPPVDIAKIVPEYGHDCIAKKRGIFKEIKNKNLKRKVEYFESDAGHAWLDTKFTKYFDDDAFYYVCSEKKVVSVKENGNLVGIVMPIKLDD